MLLSALILTSVFKSSFCDLTNHFIESSVKVAFPSILTLNCKDFAKSEKLLNDNLIVSLFCLSTLSSIALSDTCAYCSALVTLSLLNK